MSCVLREDGEDGAVVQIVTRFGDRKQCQCGGSVFRYDSSGTSPYPSAEVFAGSQNFPAAYTAKSTSGQGFLSEMRYL